MGYHGELNSGLNSIQNDTKGYFSNNRHSLNNISIMTFNIFNTVAPSHDWYMLPQIYPLVI